MRRGRGAFFDMGAAGQTLGRRFRRQGVRSLAERRARADVGIGPYEL